MTNPFYTPCSYYPPGKFDYDDRDFRLCKICGEKFNVNDMIEVQEKFKWPEYICKKCKERECE